MDNSKSRHGQVIRKVDVLSIKYSHANTENKKYISKIYIFKKDQLNYAVRTSHAS
jgi:hypothetical protein